MQKKIALGVSALVLAGGLGLWATGSKTPGMSTLAPLPANAEETTTAPADGTAATTADATTPAIEIKDFTIGAADAKVKIVEYASFTCPHCAHFHEEVFKTLKTEFIDTGKVQFEYREVYFDRYGLWAAMVARCGGDMRYFGISDILFDTQKDWAGSDDPNVVVENLKKIGRTAGMEDAALDVCLKDGANAEALVAHFEKNFKDNGVEGTPTLFVNGVKYSNMEYAKLKEIIETELAK